MRITDAHTWTLLVMGGCFLFATFPALLVEFTFAHWKFASLRGFATYAWSMFMGAVGFIIVIRELAVLTGIIAVHH
jgi:hypothetical protein